MEIFHESFVSVGGHRGTCSIGRVLVCWAIGAAKDLKRLNSKREAMGSLERKRKYRFEARDADEGGGEGEGKAVTHEGISTAPTASLQTKAGMPPLGTGSANLSNQTAVKMYCYPPNPTTTPTATSATPKQIPYSPRDPRDALAPYIISPSAHPPSIILKETPTSVFIRDAFPKALVHALLLPRDSEKTLLHPFEAFKDEGFLARIRTDAEELKGLVAKELRRKICGSGAAAGGEGVDWGAEVRVGVHAGPSMNHLHVHVISREGFSDKVKKRVHYSTLPHAPLLVRFGWEL